MKMCCTNCFGDRGLKKIIPFISSAKGQCSYCESVDQLLIQPTQLTDYFTQLIGIYRQDDNGKTLVELLKEDWLLFAHSKMDNARAKDLLTEILDDGEITRRKFVPTDACLTDLLVSWEKLRLELMHTNRFFPAKEKEIGYNRLEELVSSLLMDDEEIPEVWFRSRIQPDDIIYELKDMGAPPARLTSHGRANPAGIPYLYMGSTPKTAISETRPYPGERACVAEFKLNSSLKLVDLRNPRQRVSPFILEDETEIALLRGDIEFLEKIGTELTVPVLPSAAAIDYIPSQYLCEFIKKCKYDGVVYNSSVVADGMNLALFYPDKATPLSSSQFVVEKVHVEAKIVG